MALFCELHNVIGCAVKNGAYLFQGQQCDVAAFFERVEYNGPAISDHGSKKYRDYGKIQQEQHRTKSVCELQPSFRPASAVPKTGNIAQPLPT